MKKDMAEYISRCMKCPSKGGASTSSRFVAAFASFRMEMGSYFHGFYYRIANELEETWFHHGYGGQVDQGVTFCTSKVYFKIDSISKIFMKEIFKLHGFPKAIVSGRDPKFTSNFWKGLFADLGTKLNSTLPTILRLMDRHKEWIKFRKKCFVCIWLTNHPSGKTIYTW